MSFAERIHDRGLLLMEGALGERLKREFHLDINGVAAMAPLAYLPQGRAALTQLWGEYLSIAAAHGLPILLTTPTRRANRERVAQAGYGAEILAENLRLLRQVQAASPAESYVGGLMGCKGDAYTGAGALSAAEARRFHGWQAQSFADAGADFLMAGIMPTLDETLGMAQAMADTGLPYLISFTVEKNGCLVDGTRIDDAIRIIDGGTDVPPAAYMTNCVHPRNLLQALRQPFNDTDRVRQRFLGIQANTSPLSFSQLDGAAKLLTSSPAALAADMRRLRTQHGLTIFGGCCGTDGGHLARIADMLLEIT